MGNFSFLLHCGAMASWRHAAVLDIAHATDGGPPCRAPRWTRTPPAPRRPADPFHHLPRTLSFPLPLASSFPAVVVPSSPPSHRTAPRKSKGTAIFASVFSPSSPAESSREGSNRRWFLFPHPPRTRAVGQAPVAGVLPVVVDHARLVPVSSPFSRAHPRFSSPRLFSLSSSRRPVGHRRHRGRARPAVSPAWAGPKAGWLG